MSGDLRYWLSMAGLGVGTLLLAGLIGGTVVLVSHSELLGTIVIALIAVAGWSIGYRLRERKRLDLPLWRRLTQAQAAELDDFREFQRGGRVEADAPSSRPAGRRPSSPGTEQGRGV